VQALNANAGNARKILTRSASLIDALRLTLNYDNIILYRRRIFTLILLPTSGVRYSIKNLRNVS
jgi:hypothetical protein